MPIVCYAHRSWFKHFGNRGLCSHWKGFLLSKETGEKYFSWDHAWVQTEWDLIDGNIDSLFRNPKIETHSSIEPYWGPVSDLPKNRKYKDYGTLDAFVDLLKDMNNEILLYTPLLRKGMNH